MRVNFVTGLVLVLTLLGWGAPQQAQAQSFDCEKADTDAERAICNTPELTRMDIEAAILEQTLENAPTLSPEIKAKLLHEQEVWIHSTRHDCGGDVACLEKAYKARVSRLQETIHSALSGG